MATRNPGEFIPVEITVVVIPIIYMVLAYHPNGGWEWDVFRQQYHLQGTPKTLHLSGSSRHLAFSRSSSSIHKPRGDKKGTPHEPFI